MDKLNNNAWLNSWLFALVLSLGMLFPMDAFAVVTLNFTDIVSGPKTGNTDAAGGLTASQHGSIVTAWGNYSGASTKVYFTDAQGVSREAAHTYYEKKADGTLPGGPSDLYTFHKMREIAFSIPAGAADGLGQISLVVDGAPSSNSLPFTVRAGRLFFVRPNGSDASGDGSWNSPWATMENVVAGNNNKIKAGDIVYVAGVNAANSLQIGANGPVPGTADSPISLVAYPGFRPQISGGSLANGYSAVRNFYGINSYWNFSKLRVVTIDQGLSCYQGGRYVGDEVTVPDGTSFVGASHSGAIGCSGSAQGGGISIYGMYIHDYGKADGTADLMHHLFYISNRTGSQLPAYEIGWGNFINNPIYQGLHIYDMGTCGGWNGSFKIHHNVVKNQRGNSFNFNPDCGASISADVQLHDNLFITESSSMLSAAPIRIESNGYTGNVAIYNNTIYGYKASSKMLSGKIYLKNNILVDTDNVSYFDFNTIPPAANTNNLFSSSANPTLALPSWATQALQGDPLFNVPASEDFTLQPDSPAVNSGTDSVLAIAGSDFFNQPRAAGSVSVGALSIKSAADSIVPTVSIAAPLSGAQVSRTISISASATDLGSVTKLELYINGNLTASASQASYVFSWNTLTVANGSYSLTVKGYDAAGNVGQASTTVNVFNDTEVPAVAISAPVAGSQLGGLVTLSATASDNVAVTRVEFYVNGTLQGTALNQPYSFSWNTLSLANGSYQLSAKAYDAAGNVGQSAAVTVTVLNDLVAPTSAVTAPTAGATVSGLATVQISASDNIAVSRVEFLVNGVLQESRTSAPYSFSWNTVALANGSYQLSAKAYDAAGNVGQSAAVSVTVSNDLVAPTSAVTAPTAGATVSGLATVQISASDNSAVSRVEFLVNGVLQASRTSAPYSFSWDTAALANGSYQLSAKAYDAAGNLGQSAAVTVSVSNDSSAPVVTAFSLPGTYNSVTVPILSLSASDNTGVTGYLITESATAPAAGAAGWLASAPSSYTFLGTGLRSAYAWSKDSAGNVSAAMTGHVLIDTTLPVIKSVSLGRGDTTITIKASATDNIGVTRMQLLVDGVLQTTTTAGSLSYNWSVTFHGTHQVVVKAFDAAGNTRSQTVSVYK